MHYSGNSPTRDLFRLSLELGDFVYKNFKKSRVVSGRGVVGYGPSHKSIQARFDTDPDLNESVHEIRLRAKYGREYALSYRIRQIYGRHNFTELSMVID